MTKAVIYSKIPNTYIVLSFHLNKTNRNILIKPGTENNLLKLIKTNCIHFVRQTVDKKRIHNSFQKFDGLFIRFAKTTANNKKGTNNNKTRHELLPWLKAFKQNNSGGCLLHA